MAEVRKAGRPRRLTIDQCRLRPDGIRLEKEVEGSQASELTRLLKGITKKATVSLEN